MRTTLLSFFVTCLTLASGCSEDAQNLGGLSGAAGSASGASSGPAAGGTSGGQAQSTGGSQAAGGAESGGSGQATGGTGQATGGYSQGVGGTSGGAETGGTGQATGGASTGGTGQATGGASTGGSGPNAGGAETGGTDQATGGFSQGVGGTGQATGGASTGGTGQATGGASTGGSGQSTGGGPAAGQGGASQQGDYAVRFAFQSGQETVGDFCVLYADTAGDATWTSTRLLESNGLKAADFDGLKRMTAYLPLTGRPEQFGFVYPGQPCSQAHGSGIVPAGFHHVTVVAMPYSGEAISVWAVGDPVEDNESPGAIAAVGVRVVNASAQAASLGVTLTAVNQQTASLGTLDFAAASPAYTTFPDSALGKGDHLRTSRLVGADGTSEIDWAAAIDLLPISPPRTLYVSSAGTSQRALACEDTTRTLDGDPTASHCFFVSVP